MFKRCLKLISLALVLSAGTVSAGDGPSLEGRVVERKLANGLTVLALRRPGAPVVSLQMVFKAGGVDEPSGGTGMAHLLEHMLFKGTKRLGTSDWKSEEPILAEMEKTGTELDRLRKEEGSRADEEKLEKKLSELAEKAGKFAVKGEIDSIYSRNGAVGLNASTSPDMTNYFVSLPANRLELWAAIESERMREPVLREYYPERDVVIEERHGRNETNPTGALYSALLATAFSAHPYRNPVIGWPSDLDTLDIAATRDFYRLHYGPDNAVVAAVGDLDPEGFILLVERYFGDIPARGGKPLPPTKEPGQNGPRTVRVYFDAQPSVALAYHKPTLPAREDYVMDVIDGLLTGGDSSRMVRELVYRKKVLSSVSTTNGMPGARYDNLFTVFFEPAAGVSPSEAADAVRAELKGLVTRPPDTDELKRVVKSIEADMVRSLISDAGLARRLSYFQTVAGDWRYVEKLPEVLATVTPGEVSKAAEKYFTSANETLAVLAPKEVP